VGKYIQNAVIGALHPTEIIKTAPSWLLRKAEADEGAEWVGVKGVHSSNNADQTSGLAEGQARKLVEAGLLYAAISISLLAAGMTIRFQIEPFLGQIGFQKVDSKSNRYYVNNFNRLISLSAIYDTLSLLRKQCYME